MLKIKSEKLRDVLRQLHNTIKMVVYVKGEREGNISEINIAAGRLQSAVAYTSWESKMLSFQIQNPNKPTIGTDEDP